jgi:hypothetical protein
MNAWKIILLYFIVSLIVALLQRSLSIWAKKAGKQNLVDRFDRSLISKIILVFILPWGLLAVSGYALIDKIKRARKGASNRSAEKSQRPAGCSYLYDAGDYGGLRYWCNNSTAPGLLGQGTRIPLNDPAHLNKFCQSNFKQCPLYSLSRN